VLLNIKNHQKILTEINGQLKIFEFENGALKMTNSFTEFNNATCENGMVSYDNGYLKLWKIPQGFNLTEFGLLKRNLLFRFPVNCNVLPVRKSLSLAQTHWYFLIEKEMRQMLVNNMLVNKFIYYLTFRTEE
jgi:hypothetical protein